VVNAVKKSRREEQVGTPLHNTLLHSSCTYTVYHLSPHTTHHTSYIKQHAHTLSGMHTRHLTTQ
jgi:hypothetical protein